MTAFFSFLPQWLDISIGISQQSGSILKKYWGKIQQVRSKEFISDLVTEADRESEDLIIQLLQKFFPDHAILAEESNQAMALNEAEFLWVVDPLDGTTNYIHQYPLVAISMGLLYKGKPILGLVYNPIMEELYMGAKELGAYLNGQKISVSNTSSLENSLLGTGFAYDRCVNPDNNYAEFCYFTHLTQGVRRGGAASLDLAYIAAGRLDGYWESGLKPWDMAAGIIIVEEAGGQVTDYNLNEVSLESGRILASNRFLQPILSEELLHLQKSKSINQMNSI